MKIVSSCEICSSRSLGTSAIDPWVSNGFGRVCLRHFGRFTSVVVAKFASVFVVLGDDKCVVVTLLMRSVAAD